MVQKLTKTLAAVSARDIFSVIWLPLELLCVAGGMIMLAVCLSRSSADTKPVGPAYVLPTVILWLFAIGLFLAGNILT